MFYVYVLISLKDGDLYIGSTEDLERRLYFHNSGKTRSTKFYRPWQLLGSEIFVTRSEAVKREVEINWVEKNNVYVSIIAADFSSLLRLAFARAYGFAFCLPKPFF